MNASEQLATYGITVQQADDFITANLGNSKLIVDTAKQYGVTTAMLGEILGTAGSSVMNYMAQHGIDSAVLDSKTIFSVNFGLGGINKIAIDNSNNIYFSGSENGSINEIISGSSKATIIANGLNNPTNIALDNNGNVFFTDSGSGAIKELTTGTHTVTAPAFFTDLYAQGGISIDSSGNVYLVDSWNGAIKEVVTGTQKVVTITGGLSHNLSGVAVDSSGNIYFSEPGSFSIKEIVAGSQSVTTLVSNVAALSGLAVDHSGNIYFVDNVNGAIKEIAANTHAITTLSAGSSNYISGIAVDGNGNLFYSVPSFGFTASVIKEIPASAISAATNIDLVGVSTHAASMGWIQHGVS